MRRLRPPSEEPGAGQAGASNRSLDRDLLCVCAGRVGGNWARAGLLQRQGRASDDGCKLLDGDHLGGTRALGGSRARATREAPTMITSSAPATHSPRRRHPRPATYFPCRRCPPADGRVRARVPLCRCRVVLDHSQRQAYRYADASRAYRCADEWLHHHQSRGIVRYYLSLPWSF